MKISKGKKVAVFISDHGLGHASRCCAVISELCKRGANVLVVSKIPEWFFLESCPLATSPSSSPTTKGGSLEFYSFKTEVGTHQLTSVDIDPKLTLAHLKEYWEHYFPEEKPKLVGTLRNWGVEVIYFDVTATAPLIAKELEVPSVAITNFSFDFIYSEYISRDDPPSSPSLSPFTSGDDDLPSPMFSPFPSPSVSPSSSPTISSFSTLQSASFFLSTNLFERYVKLYANAYRQATALLKLPYPCDLSNWDECPINRDLGAWICRPVTQSKEFVRTVIETQLSEAGQLPTSRGVSPRRKYMLLSFGGHDIPIFERLENWSIPSDWVVIWIDQSLTVSSFFQASSGAIVVSQEFLRSQCVNYVDLVAAMDLVILKTGYGIVSEVITNGVSVLYVDRPGFQEHLYLEQALKENVSCKRIETQDVWKGTTELWRQADEVVRNRIEHTSSNVKSNGAELAADFILSL